MQVGRMHDETGWTSYRLGVGRSFGGPLTIDAHGIYLKRDGGPGGGFAGIGADLAAFRGASAGPYVVAGLDLGLGSERGTRLSDAWGSWSAGAGYEVFPAAALALGAEARWREMTAGGPGGMQLSLGMRLRFGGGPSATPRQPAPSAAAVPLGVRSPAAVTDSVLATAEEMMGRRYQFGGTGAGGEGFDCSGLIQYAFGRHGISLPRRSADQAKRGSAVPKRLEDLAPGDVLTFSSRGGRVTHVGLYLGGGRFIHSASRGVQVSALSEDDAYGRWWYRRWVGVRRIVQ